MARCLKLFFRKVSKYLLFNKIQVKQFMHCALCICSLALWRWAPIHKAVE
jgi:hypothetical protein